MTRLRLPIRLARREVWRRPGRSALVALLVALPVAGMAIAVVLLRTDGSTTSLERWEREHGQADAVLYPGVPTEVRTAAPVAGRPDSEPPDAPDVELPAGTRVVSVRSGWGRIRTADGHRASVDVVDLPLLDPLTSGIHDLVDGRPASRPGEVVLGAQLAGRLGTQVGDALALVRPEERAFRVVGLVEPVGCLSCPVVLVAPGAADSFPTDQPPAEVQLLDLPSGLSPVEVQAWADGAETQVFTRQAAVDPERYAPVFDPTYRDDATSEIRWSLVLGSLALTVVGIVISAAFAVGARRQLVMLGQLAASGASPATVRTTLVLQGTVTGLVGAAAGLVLAAGSLILGRGLVERIFDERIDGYVVRPADLLAVVLIGVVAATVAALIPARTAARIPTLAALAGRRPLAPVSRRLLGWGVAAFVGGLALLGLATVGSQSGSSGELWAYVAILGGVSELLGACALAPAAVARLEPLAMRMRGAWRLGARALARHRSRTGAVVSAVAAAGALAVASAGLLLGSEARSGQGQDVADDVVVVRAVTSLDSYPFEHSSLPSDEVRAEVADALASGATETVIRATAPPVAQDEERDGRWSAEGAHRDAGFYAESDAALVGDRGVLELLHASAAVRAALDEIGVVALTEEGAHPLVVTLPDGRSVDAVGVPSRHVLGYSSEILISEARAGELGLDLVPVAAGFQADHPLTGDEREALEDVQFDASSSETYTEVRWHYPLSGPTPFQIELILTGLTLVFSVFVVGVSLALAAAESRDERDVLTVAGAAPATLARSAGARAWLLAAMGGAMAIPAGFLPVVVFARAQSTDGLASRFPLIFPARTALVLLVLVPALLALIAWSSSAASQRLRPVRVSTATFE